MHGFFQMTASNRSVNGHVQFAHSSVQYLADLNQCQHISDECVKYLTLETSNRVRSLLQVSGKKPRWNLIECFSLGCIEIYTKKSTNEDASQ